MLLKHKTIFLAVYIFLKVGKVRQEITCVLVLWCSRNKGSDFFDFILVDRKKNVYLSDGILPYFTPNEQAEGYHFVNVS